MKKRYEILQQFIHVTFYVGYLLICFSYRSQQDAYVCDNTNSFGWTGLLSHIYMASVDAQKKTQR
jgi:hypothetical protein